MKFFKNKKTEKVKKSAVPVETGEGDMEKTEKESGHLVAKLMCLVVAFGIWLYVTGTGDALEERTIVEVPVSLIGVSDLHMATDMSVIYGYDEMVDVIVTGKRSDVLALTADDLSASADVSVLTEAGRFSLPVNIQLPAGISVVGGEGISINVYVDLDMTKQVPVRVANLDYVIDASYRVGEPKLSLDAVTVKGPGLVLDTIEYAGVSFNLGTMMTSMTMVATPYLYDRDGERISNPYVRCSTTEIVVNIPVYTQKTLPLSAQYALPEYKEIYTVQFDPAGVTVQGDPSLINRLEDIVAFTVDKSIREGEYTVSFPELPTGLTQVGGLTSIRVRVSRVVHDGE